MPVYLDHAGVAALDGAHLRDVADLGDGLLHAGLGAAVEKVDEQFAGVRGNRETVDGELHVGGVVGGSVE